MHDSDWLATFDGLHQLARSGRLTGLERQYYLLLREQISYAILDEARTNLPEDRPPRRTVRVAQTFPVELELPSGRVQMLTRSLSAGGFGGLLPVDPGTEAVRFSLRLPEGLVIAGLARAVARQPRQRSLLASFAFIDLPPEAFDRIQTAIFDTVLRQIETD